MAALADDDDDISILHSTATISNGNGAIKWEDDEITLLYATSSSKKGSTKHDPIPVDNYRSRIKARVVIDLSDDSAAPPRRRLYRGECSNSKEPEPPCPRFTCEICTDEKAASEAFNVLGCTHAYCAECVARYVASKVQDNVSTVGCPVVGCRGYFEPQQCRLILPDRVLERWGDALCEAVIVGSEKLYCPYKDCSALLIHDRGEEGVVVQSECPECNRLFCAQCRVTWHAGIGCEEFQKLHKDERSSEDIKLMNLAKKNKWVRCPRCRIFVSRSEGCLFMRCRCGFTFCYNCGAPLEERLHYCKKCKH